MKILHVVPAIGSIYGGPSISVLSLANALGQLGIEVDIITTNVNGEEILDVPLRTWLQGEHYRIQYFPCWYLKDYKISSAMSGWLSQHIRDYDLVNTHAIFSYSIFPAYRACQRHNVPYVMHPHGMLENWALNYKSWKKTPYYHLIEKPAITQASAIRVLAQSEADSLQQLNLGTPLARVPNGIWQSDFIQMPDRQEFDRAFPKTNGKTLILFLGRIDPKKGLDLLASAFAQVRQQFPNAHLVLAGPDNIGFQPTAESYFAEVGCLDAVTFTGILTGNLKYSALAAATIYTAPSYSEGFSMSVLEGMAAGLPCVITTGCNFPESATANAAHLVAIDAEAIAKALIYCLRDPDAAQAMGQRARKFVFEQYSWEAIGKQMLNVYQEIIAQPKAVVSANR
jgi:glycosyltransferase involved in cell wall biosynthesis